MNTFYIFLIEININLHLSTSLKYVLKVFFVKLIVWTIRLEATTDEKRFLMLDDIASRNRTTY